MNNYYIRKINNMSSSSTLLLYGRGSSVTWDQRYNFCVRYLKKLYAYYVIKAQMNYMDHKISDDQLIGLYRYYDRILTKIEKDGFISYFIEKAKTTLIKEKRTTLFEYNEGSITAEASKNRLASTQRRERFLKEIENNEQFSLKYAITEAELILIEAIKKNINLDKVAKIINEQTYKATIKEIKLTLMDYDSKLN